MTLKEHIEDIQIRLEQNKFTSEAAVRQGIIDRLLGALAWPTHETEVVFPEYGVEERKVDYALCHPPGRPRVFIEVKRVGYIEGAEEQLFGYAFHEGVPIAILTDGQKWRFFHPTGEGKFRERKVHELDLIESNNEENVERLNRYLNYEAVRKGDAITAIKNDYQNVSKQREIEGRLPEAWSKLLQDEDEFLLETMIDKTESLCGARPATEQVLSFLKSLERKTESYRKESSPHPGPNPKSSTSYHSSSTSKKPPQKLIVTMSDGTLINHHNAVQTFVEVIVKEVIEKLNPEEVSRIYPTIISTTSFGPKPEYQHGEFYINLKTATSYKKKILEKIARDLGIQLKVDIVDK